MLPDATQVDRPVSCGAPGELRNWMSADAAVQNETLGHRGRKHDPLYRARRLLTKAHERLDQKGDVKLRGLLDAGDPRGEVRMMWHAKETTRQIYDIDDPALAVEFVDQLTVDLCDTSMPPEVRSLGRTIRRWSGSDRGMASGIGCRTDRPKPSTTSSSV